MSEVSLEIDWLDPDVYDELSHLETIDMAECVARVRHEMIRKSQSQEVERERHREAVATSKFLDDPVIYSSR